MGRNRKDYRHIPDTRLDRLKSDSGRLRGTKGQLLLPADTVHSLVAEVIDSREEIFRLQLCETVDQILASELEDEEEDLLAFQWPDALYLASDMRDSVRMHKPAFPCRETTEIPRPSEGAEPSPEQEGRRLPRAD